MHRKPGAALLRRALLLTTLTALAGTLGCGPSAAPPPAEDGAVSQAAQAEWNWLQETRKELDRRRTAIAGSAGKADPKLVQGTEALTLEFNRRLVALINADPPVQGEPLSERQKAAIRMKSDEDILVAREHIEEGGDYQRAIEIYEEALAVDPDNPRLAAELAKARQRRFITAEAFAQVKEGMKDAEVRTLLGQPNLHNVREYAERGVIAWFYPKDESGAAAGVWFEKKPGGLVVYELDFEAIQPGQPHPAGAPTT